jgi:sucrose-6-phosphate hydrolase SacC (GH32 family)
LEKLADRHTGNDDGLVAVYTLNEPTKELQNVAYGLDNGASYIEYQGNPVLDLQNPNFRDPKVFWSFRARRSGWPLPRVETPG